MRQSHIALLSCPVRTHWLKGFILFYGGWRSTTLTGDKLTGCAGQTIYDSRTNLHTKMQYPYRVFRIWICEIFSITFAMGLVSAIVAILVSYHGKEVPDWGVNLNINALLALLSTILRAMLVVVISQIVCQQKWEWYGGEHARPLSDFPI
jgi:hypothetical protein